METEQAGIERYMRHTKELMSYAYSKGLEALTIEPMSCLAEPPTLPGELIGMAEELNDYHKTHPRTVPVRYCTDVAHGYADSQGRVVHDNMELLEVTLPYLQEVHLKNTDEIFNATFGFSEEELARGIVDIPAVRDLLLANAERIPVDQIVGYFETSGPKFGRDYSDRKLEDQLRLSLRYLVRAFTVSNEVKERSQST
jgi:ribulose-phosphate 3-epimerase